MVDFSKEYGLRDSFEIVFNNILEDKKTREMKDKPTFIAIKTLIPNAIEKIIVEKYGSKFVLQGTCGAGWADIVGVAVLDPRISTNEKKHVTMQCGVYPTYLFSKDGKRLLLGLAHHTYKEPKVSSKVEKIRSSIDTGSFRTDNDAIADTLEEGDKHDYVKSLVAFKEYALDNLPDEQTLQRDLLDMMEVFDRYLSTFDDGDDEGSGDSDEGSGDASGTTKNGYNKIFYGVPGCGKSYKVQKEVLKELGIGEKDCIRITFHPEYSNSDFVGQIMPYVKDGVVSYKFNPGPFTEALTRALENAKQSVALVIEELNRGNAAAIFGDIFQLLDRNEDGWSQYPICNRQIYEHLIKNEKIKSYLNSKELTDGKVAIPGNLFIFATMNTSDQGVFVLDTAFTRRWRFEYVCNEFADGTPMKNYELPKMDGVTWGQFIKIVNEHIVSHSVSSNSEDKQIGAYFLEDITKCGQDEAASLFANKVLRYLWNDVSKYKHEAIFNKKFTSFEKMFDAYMKGDKGVFCEDLCDKFWSGTPTAKGQ